MGIKQKLLLLGVSALSLGMAFKVTSFTFAEVKNTVNFEISSSENALISMPDLIEVKVNKTFTEIKTLSNEKPINISEVELYRVNKLETLADNKPIYVIKKETVISPKLESHNFNIKNNMKDSIIVNIDSGTGFFIQNTTMNGITILPGETQKVPISIDDSIENESFDIVVSAVWSGGTAEIKKSVTIDVNIITIEDVIDLREQIIIN